jgi:murein DD-endopeptidase MepM/ murein hydrolase activator NlpD
VSRRVKVRALCALMSGLVVVASVAQPAPAQTRTSDIGRRLAELRRATERLEGRERALRRGISAGAARRGLLDARLAGMQDDVESVQARVDAAAAVLAGVQARLDRKTAELRRTERALEKTLGLLHRRATEVYKHGPLSLIDMLVGAEGFGDFLRRLGFTLHLARSDNARVDEIERTKAIVKRERAVIVTERDRAARRMAFVAAARDRVASVANAIAARRNAVANDIAASYSQLGDVRRQKERYLREQAQLEAESAGIGAFLRGHSVGPARVSPRGMVWPTQGPVTSGYGYRVHPIFKTRRFHAGIDIGAPYGAPVIAAAHGTVLRATAQSGYGNMLVIDHGGGIATVYSHLSSFVVGTGAEVSRGRQIARVGCTGYCTGPHLHFEVRVNGSPVNPLGWLP